jgi:signal transduction histidine kinase
MVRLRAATRRRLSFASLGGKLLLILASVGLVGSIALTVLLALVITPSFNALERQAIDGHVQRTRAALSDFATKVESSVRDYGDWNASYDYIVKPTRAFELESFSPLAMANLDVDAMAYLRPDRSLVIARWIDPRTGRENDTLRDAMVSAIRSAPLDDAMKGNNSGHFYVRLGKIVAAVGVAKVRKSDGSGAPRGYVVMARRITSEQLAKLLQVPARLDLNSNGGELVTTSPTMMQIAVPVAGAEGKPVAVASFVVPRDVSQLGRHMLWLAVLGSTILLALVLAVLSRMFSLLVLKPLGRVEGHMQRVRNSGSLSVLPQHGARRDEIASLGNSFNAMLVQLKELREQVEAQGFELGRSESAVAVMHNVRNALNPVSTILSTGIGQGAPVERALIERALAELVAAETVPERREKLASFIAAAFEAEDKQREDRIGQLQVGRDAMRQVLEIIGAQQQLAQERPPLEECDATQIIAQNATIARHSGDGASIAFNFPAKKHKVMANRVLLSQVVGNLFSNAAEAISAAGGSGSINVTITETSDDRVEIAIHDTGEGFDPVGAQRLFQRGFSTREHKSGGFGLHWCANSVTAMEGSLNLESDGVGRGATARLVLRAPEHEATKADLAA